MWSGFGDAESTCWPCSWGHVRLKSFSLTPRPQLSAAGVNLHGQAAPLPPEACHLLDFLSFCNVRFITFSLMCNYGHKSDMAQPGPGSGDDRLFMSQPEVTCSSHHTIR